MLGRTDSRLRLIALLGVMAIVASLLGLRLAYWQIGQGAELRQLAQAQLSRPHEQAIQRGQITDQRGNVLATTVYRDLLAAYPDLMNSEERVSIAHRLSNILGLDETEAADLWRSFKDRPQYIIVARRLTEEQSDAVRAGLASGDLDALDLEPHPVRFYPSTGGSPGTTLASQLLGFVTADGQGNYGVEQTSNDLLAGQPGVTADTGGAPAVPRSGGTVQLTIDASLQLRLEKELYAAWVANRAQRVSGLVMDPYTGAVLAWASVPGYDANDFAATADTAPDLFGDPIVSQIYEPGSVMKMYTAAAALERGVLDLRTPVQDDKFLLLGSNKVRNFDRGSLGTIAFEDAIAQSRNVATGRVALMLGQTVDDASAVLFNLWTRLGIGRPTGIELRGEAAGLADDPGQTEWQAIDLVNRAFGQAVAVTPLQLAVGFSAMVNGGKLPTPHIYAALDGELAEPGPGAQVLDGALSDKLRELMIHVVQAGPQYAEETLIPHYVVGGKTGTAQIWDNDAGQWMDNVYNHTFVGFVGAERPEAVILVRIHETEPRIKRRWGYTLELTSNELFRRVALDTIEVLDIPPLTPPDGPPALPGSQPDPQASGAPAQSSGWVRP